jgi:hypothetical protein
MATKKKAVKAKKGKIKPGPKPSGGPRVQVRFQTDAQVAAIEKAVEKINQASKYGETITFNSFVANAAIKAAEAVNK